MILADACDRHGIAPELNSLEFYQDVRRSLAPGGVFVINVCGDMEARNAHILKIRDAFDDELAILQAGPYGNVIVFAFREHREEVRREQLDRAAADLKLRLGLDFPKYLRSIELNRELRRWQHIFT